MILFLIFILSPLLAGLLWVLLGTCVAAWLVPDFNPRYDWECVMFWPVTILFWVGDRFGMFDTEKVSDSYPDIDE